MKGSIFLKTAVILVIMLAAVFVYGTGNDTTEEYQGILRFHVLANSDSREDQALKIKVRDHILEKINGDMSIKTMNMHETDGAATESTDITCEISLGEQEMRDYIKENLSEIELAAEEFVKQCGYNYDVTAALGTTWIPQKTYGKTVFPAGNYEALRIVIGEGHGENWWCVLFPPLCVIDPEGESLEGLQISEGTDGLVLSLKFKTLELLRGNEKKEPAESKENSGRKAIVSQ